MNVDLTLYKNKRICVALSGGKDSMALFHYILSHGAEYGITLSALNCDHCMRGEASARDSEFVRQYCAANSIKLHFFKADGLKFSNENDARVWRLKCYESVINSGEADCIATAHHMNDNAETVLFNLARGAALSGMTGITDSSANSVIRPLISCDRGEIDRYIEKNNIPFVTDDTNFKDDYTRNKIRHTVIPALEEAVSGAVGNIYRFSRLAAEDEEYFSRQVKKVLVNRPQGGFLIKSCTEPVIFKRAVRQIVQSYSKKDFTAAQLRTVYEMQWLGNGKKFAFLGLTAVKEEGGIAVTEDSPTVEEEEISFSDYLSCGEKEYCGKPAAVGLEKTFTDKNSFGGATVKVLRFDTEKIPENAVVRFRRDGDRFTKFGGGSKSLSDYFTDRKIPQSLRNCVPLVCLGSEVYIVGGVEISEKVKVTPQTEHVGVFVCLDPFKID